jgi:hypothetical protein
MKHTLSSRRACVWGIKFYQKKITALPFRRLSFLNAVEFRRLN